MVMTAATRPLPSLTPLEQSVLTRTRSQAATRLAPSATAKLKTISNSLAHGGALNDYGDTTRRAVIGAFPDVKLTQAEVNSLSAIVLADSIDALKTEMGTNTQLQTQMAMDRLSKMMSTLSNLLKRMNDSSDAITKNLK